MGSENESGEKYQLGVALVSILVSIAVGVGFGVYSTVKSWWLAVVLAIAAPTALAIAIRLGGDDGVIPRIGTWVLGSGGDSKQ